VTDIISDVVLGSF